MVSPLVKQLYTQLRERCDVLFHMGELANDCDTLPASWWSDAPVRCWWMFGPQRRLHLDVRKVNLREAAEALVLLGALASVDYHACGKLYEAIWGDVVVELDDDERENTMQCRVIGYQYTVRVSDDLAPITERVLGVHAPRNTYLNEFVWIKQEMAKLGDGLFRPRAIPVQLNIGLVRQDPAELSYVLRQILQSVLMQRMLVQSTSPVDDIAEAALCSRFEIIQVQLSERSFPAADAESLECLARLVELGITVRRLPAVQDERLSSNAHLSVVKSLQVLVPSHRDSGAKQSPIQYVYVSNVSFNLMPALFSALQVNTSVFSVELQSIWDPRDGNEADAQQQALHMWRWLAYALFSRQTHQELDQLTVHVDKLDEHAIEGMQGVLLADNPLAALFRTSFENDRWLVASTFEIEKPRFTRNADERVLFRTTAPLLVRVIDVVEIDGVSWWHVLLPGCGEAWVDERNATAIEPSDGLAAPVSQRRPQGLQHISFKGIIPRNHRHVVDLLELVGSNIGSIDVETGNSIYDAFDMTQWMLDVLRNCPRLESLSLPWNAEIRNFRGLVEAAEAGQFPLRELTLDYRLDTDSSDVLEFLGVLSNTSHALTKRLEELSLAVSILTTPVQEFDAAWQRMLQRNRTLHTITLDLHADACVQESDVPVAIRTGPLRLVSKLAFLSVVHQSHGSARRQLDTAVLSIVLAFAAEHCLRTVEIDFANE